MKYLKDYVLGGQVKASVVSKSNRLEIVDMRNLQVPFDTEKREYS